MRVGIKRDCKDECWGGNGLHAVEAVEHEEEIDRVGARSNCSDCAVLKKTEPETFCAENKDAVIVTELVIFEVLYISPNIHSPL